MAETTITPQQMTQQLEDMYQKQMEMNIIQNKYATKSSIAKAEAETKQSMARNIALQH